MLKLNIENYAFLNIGFNISTESKYCGRVVSIPQQIIVDCLFLNTKQV